MPGPHRGQPLSRQMGRKVQEVTTLCSTGQIILGKDCTLSLFASIFYNPIWFLSTKGKLPPASHGFASVAVSSHGLHWHLLLHHLHHLKSGLQEVYCGQFPCWWSPHWARELQQQEEDVLAEGRAWCTQTLFSRAAAHLTSKPCLFSVLPEGQPTSPNLDLVQIHPGFHMNLINSAAAMTKGHNQTNLYYSKSSLLRLNPHR